MHSIARPSCRHKNIRICLMFRNFNRCIVKLLKCQLKFKQVLFIFYPHWCLLYSLAACLFAKATFRALTPRIWRTHWLQTSKKTVVTMAIGNPLTYTEYWLFLHVMNVSIDNNKNSCTFTHFWWIIDWFRVRCKYKQ